MWNLDGCAFRTPLKVLFPEVTTSLKLAFDAATTRFQLLLKLSCLVAVRTWWRRFVTSCWRIRWWRHTRWRCTPWSGYIRSWPAASSTSCRIKTKEAATGAMEWNGRRSVSASDWCLARLWLVMRDCLVMRLVFLASLCGLQVGVNAQFSRIFAPQSDNYFIERVFVFGRVSGYVGKKCSWKTAIFGKTNPKFPESFIWRRKSFADEPTSLLRLFKFLSF